MCEMFIWLSCKKKLKLRDGPNCKAWCLSLFWITIVLCRFLQCLLGIVFGPQTNAYDKADEEEISGVSVAKFLAAIRTYAHFSTVQGRKIHFRVLICGPLNTRCQFMEAAGKTEWSHAKEHGGNMALVWLIWCGPRSWIDETQQDWCHRQIRFRLTHAG